MPGEAAKSVTRTVGILSVTKILTWISSSALMFVLPRYLGPEEYGKFFLGTSVVAILGVIVEFGREYSVAKAISRDQDSAAKIVVNAIGARTLIGVLAYIGIVVFAIVARYPADVRWILCILGIPLFWRGTSAVLWSYFQGIEMMKYPSYGGIIESFLIALLSIIALMNGAKADVLAWILVACGFINVVICSAFARRLLPRRLPRIDRRESLRLLKEGVPYFLNTMFGIISYRVDTVMLSLLTSAKVVGWYGASYRLFDVMMFIPTIFSISVFPILARSWDDRDALARMAKKSLDFILLAGIPIAVGIFAFAPQIITVIFGIEGYQPSILVMRIFGVGLLLVYVDVILGTTLLAADKQRQLSMSAFAAIFLNVGLNIWLIPYTQNRFGNGGIGAGITTVVTEFFIMILMLSMMPPRLLRDSSVVVQLKAVAAGCVMGLSIGLMNLVGFHWIVQGSVSLLVYGVMILALKAVSSSELALVQNALPFGRRQPQEKKVGL